MDLFDLAFTSYIYDFFTSFNESYKSFLKRVDYDLDLLDPKDRRALIVWLNRWGCRQFSLDYHELASNEILSWYNEGYLEVIPEEKRLWELNKKEFKEIRATYAELAQKTASRKKRNGDLLSISVGPTGASKILFALRPEVFVPWDIAIRKGLGYNDDSSSYVNYLKQAKSLIESLSTSCDKNDVELLEVPQKLGREKATVAQLIGEYYWVTETKDCYPPSPDTVQQWAKWSEDS
ncbi:hypothetical protein C9439_00090 [archaeon SCG-AAA382B04]|nr:hypothetical protein C9439_00090 [archaeon SCG-AAA382B04]